MIKTGVGGVILKIWKLTYELCCHYSSTVTRQSYTLRCFPREMMYQKVQSCKYEVWPCSGGSRGRDSFGNSLLIGRSDEEHDWFLVKVDSIVMTEKIAEPEIREYHQLGMYRNVTKLTVPGEKLNIFSQMISDKNKEDPWERTAFLMKKLADVFQYKSGSTSFHTTAEEAFAQGCGVCQDYSHILLALCRNENMTARYVAGTIPGEGQTHAWIEVWNQGRWKGFDPTNNRVVDEDYICLAYGRDAADCSLSQGIFVGGVSQQQHIYVKMEES